MPSGFGDLVALAHLNLSYSFLSEVTPSRISHLSKLAFLDLSWLDGMRIEAATLEKIIVNATDIRELALDALNMSTIKPKSLSLLVNFSSSLVSLKLSDTQPQGKLSENRPCLPNLRNLDLSVHENLEGELPKFNWTISLRFLDLSRTSFSRKVFNSINHLKSLNYLDFSWSYFEGPILLFLSNLTQLKHLDLCGNKFSGEIPLSISMLQHLIHIDLSRNNFTGPIPQSLGNITQLNYLSLGWNNFSGEIPQFLFNLQHLTKLDLSQNNLSGEIPDLFGKLRKLETVDLSANNLVGQLPLSLFGSTQLRFLLCSYNKLVGPIPDKISELSNLAFLDLSLNSLNGTIPQWCFSLPSLYLFRNQLTGPIPEFSYFSLQWCDLSNNKLQGNIPKSMFRLQNLKYLQLSSNNLSGLVDFHKFSNLHYLFYLDLSKNNFLSLSLYDGDDYTFPNLRYLSLSSCNIDTFPNFLSRLPYIEHLDLSKNRLRGSIPKWFNKTLDVLDLSHNFLTSVGYLWVSWSNNRFIDLSFNMLEGDIPVPPFGTQFFSVSNNRLSGHITSAICNASSLQILNLSHNNLTGKLPQCLGTLPYLTVLGLQRNNLRGIIPTTYLKLQALETINFNGNQLEGPLPRSVVKCKRLRVLDIGENNIQDTFPSWIESLQQLEVLVLRVNRFNGTINCLKSNISFLMLRVFDISNNNFGGNLPTTCIKNFKAMMMNINNGMQYMSSSSYNDSIVVSIKGNTFELERILTTFTTIDLSCNKFEGVIPTIMGKLESLKELNLSNNKIIGSIPQTIGGLENLESLDLSSNMLAGEIPMALTNVFFLSFLNLSDNQLVGMIPKGKQFNTFQNDSYKSNPGLCGWPLSKSCHGDEKQPTDSTKIQHDEHFWFGWKPVAIGYAFGGVFGIVLGYIVFFVRKPQWSMRFVESILNQRVRKKSPRSNANSRRQNQGR